MQQTLNESERISSINFSIPNMLLRLEGLTVFIGAIALYASQGFSGLAFIALLLVPDVSMIGYKVNIRVGSWAYNVAHLYTVPSIFIALGVALNAPVAIQIGLIWFAHIGMDPRDGFRTEIPH